MSTAPLSVVILAAGKGTRMKSALPKVRHSIGGKSMLARVIEVSMALKPASTIVVYGHGGERIKDGMENYPVAWALQEQQLGTGHAVAQALPEINDNQTVLILYGDVPLITQQTLERLIEQVSPTSLALLTATLADPTGYGRIVRDATGKVQAIVEQKDASEAQLGIAEINTGMMAANGGMLKQWIERLDNQNAQGEYYLTDIIAMAVSDSVAIATESPDALVEIEGVNNKLQLANLERAYQQRKASEYLLNGLTLRDPARFDVRGTLSFGEDVVIDINVILEGEVRLGDRVNIGANVILKNVSIGDDTTIQPNSVLENSQLGNGCEVGPFARIRPQTVLADKVKIGNFVEVKKSTIAEGSKVNHLSYVGDTTMGKNVNVGAGSITCNYDGANKYQTIIGDDVFIGSDTQLIAPVTIADGATIGAGSTITRDAPAHSLTLSRSQQITKEDWKRPIKK